MKTSIFLATILFVGFFSASAQSDLNSFKNLHVLDASGMEQIIYANKKNGFSPFHGMQVLYTINTNSVKINSTELTTLLAALKNKGAIDSYYDTSAFVFYVKSQKELTYLRIEDIKQILKEYSVLEIEQYTEEIYSNN